MKTKHFYHAVLEGGSVKVYDSDNNPIKVEFAGTMDNCTCYAYVASEGGFIGGWQRRANAKKGFPWKSLVDAINRGIHYDDMNELPKTP
jgi:hypothetical protein